MFRLTLPILGLLAFAACGRFKEENWPATAAAASCKTFRRCNPVGFYNSYDTHDECVTQTTVVPAAATDCGYDKARAKDCIDALGWSCEKLGERWDEVDELCRSVTQCGSTTGDTGV